MSWTWTGLFCVQMEKCWMAVVHTLSALPNQVLDSCMNIVRSGPTLHPIILSWEIHHFCDEKHSIMVGNPPKRSSHRSIIHVDGTVVRAWSTNKRLPSGSHKAILILQRWSNFPCRNEISVTKKVHHHPWISKGWRSRSYMICPSPC